ncbi:MAG: cysteine-rich KTR domain-containing protein [Clostridiales bacterium]|nr:cysteine-rich KTR domain-containing protein [Clostridiales bacterium]
MNVTNKGEWLLCPICRGKTRTRIRRDTTLINFPLFCPKCGQENLVNVRESKMIVIREPDAKGA